MDAAPLILAQEAGLFAREGLHVELKQVPGWATIRDMLAQNELDAAHCLAGLLFGAAAGVGCLPTKLTTGLFLNTHGNAIVLSKSLYDQGVRDAASLAAAVKAKTLQLPLVFGVVHNLSSHFILLVSWLARHGLRLKEHYQIVVLPPNLMGDNLGSGHLDGFCSGEPWGSGAALSNQGFIAATSVDIMPLHVEKVLAVPDMLVRSRRDDIVALHRAVAKACRMCDDLGVRADLAQMLANPDYIGVPEEWIFNSLVGTSRLGFGMSRPIRDFHIFHGTDVNQPQASRLAWLRQELVRHGHLPDGLPSKSDDFIDCELLPNAETESLVKPTQLTTV